MGLVKRQTELGWGRVGVNNKGDIAQRLLCLLYHIPFTILLPRAPAQELVDSFSSRFVGVPSSPKDNTHDHSTPFLNASDVS